MEELDEFYGVYFTFKDDIKNIKLKKKETYILIDNQGNEVSGTIIKELDKKNKTYLFDIEEIGEVALMLDKDENDNLVLILID